MRVWSDQELEVKVGRLLQWGVSLAALAMLTGAGVFLFRYGGARADFRTFDASNAWPPGSGIIEFAIALMVATPVARVVFAAYSFLRQRDWRFAGVSFTVLILLLYALFRAL